MRVDGGEEVVEEQSRRRLVFFFIYRRCSFNAIPYITDIHFLISQTRRGKAGRGHAQKSQSDIMFYILMMVVGFFGELRDGLLFSLYHGLPSCPPSSSSIVISSHDILTSMSLGWICAWRWSCDWKYPCPGFPCGSC